MGTGSSCWGDHAHMDFFCNKDPRDHLPCRANIGIMFYCVKTFIQRIMHGWDYTLEVTRGVCDKQNFNFRCILYSLWITNDKGNSTVVCVHKRSKNLNSSDMRTTGLLFTVWPWQYVNTCSTNMGWLWHLYYGYWLTCLYFLSRNGLAEFLFLP